MTVDRGCGRLPFDKPFDKLRGRSGAAQGP